jgi:hypothetical protein
LGEPSDSFAKDASTLKVNGAAILRFAERFDNRWMPTWASKSAPAPNQRRFHRAALMIGDAFTSRAGRQLR